VADLRASVAHSASCGVAWIWRVVVIQLSMTSPGPHPGIFRAPVSDRLPTGADRHLQLPCSHGKPPGPSGNLVPPIVPSPRSPVVAFSPGTTDAGQLILPRTPLGSNLIHFPFQKVLLSLYLGAYFVPSLASPPPKLAMVRRISGVLVLIQTICAVICQIMRGHGLCTVALPSTSSVCPPFVFHVVHFYPPPTSVLSAEAPPSILRDPRSREVAGSGPNLPSRALPRTRNRSTGHLRCRTALHLWGRRT